MWTQARSRGLRTLALVGLLAGLFAGTGHGMSFDTYDVTGSRRLGQFGDGDVEGTLRFFAGGGDFDADLLSVPGLVGFAPTSFDGTHSELNLFLISFWSFEGMGNNTFEANGSGIRLFFGLLVFGSILSNGYTIEFSGFFAGQETIERGPVRGVRGRAKLRMERAAEARRERPVVAME